MEMNRNRTYIAIDLKSFFASVECMERKLDPLDTNLVVADASRTEKTICLAVTPSLKAYGISGRARLFEVVQRVEEVNKERKRKNNGVEWTGSAYSDRELKSDQTRKVDYIVAPPRMALYMEYSTRVYQIYLRYIAPEDIHVYSIDEVMMDVTEYLSTYHMTSKQLAQKIIQDIYHETGITATAGIGTNLYLCKVAMDIVAKHAKPDEYGTRIAELDEMTYRKQLWSHRPLTDFWRVGRGYRKKLEENGLFTMGDVARCSLGKSNEYHNEELLYRLFGVNAELLIDHAWGYEPVTIADVKNYRPRTKGTSNSQVLMHPYDFSKAKLVLKEMIDHAVLDLVEKKLVTNQIVLTVGYDVENLNKPETAKLYRGDINTDIYGRRVPKPAHGSVTLKNHTSSTELIMKETMKLYEEIVNPMLSIRKITISCMQLLNEEEFEESAEEFEQLDLFTDYEVIEKKREEERKHKKKERQLQEALLSVKKKYGKNAIVKGMSLEEGATALERNGQIGGHKA